MSNEKLVSQAEKFWKEYLTGPTEKILTTPDCMANFAAQIREETIEQCARVADKAYAPMQDSANASGGLPSVGLQLAVAIRNLAGKE